jgi:hypothetical protein
MRDSIESFDESAKRHSRWQKNVFMAKRTIVLLLVISLDIGAAAYLAWRSFGLASLGIFDLEIHHTAFAAASNGNNPYDMATLKSYLDPASGYIQRSEAAFFYPPWTLLLLAPVLMLPIRTAGLAWLAMNLVFLAAISFLALSWRRSCSDCRFYVVCGSIFWFPPAIDALMFGQINILCTFALVGMAWALDRKRDWVAGIMLPIVLLKPHLTFLPLIIFGLFAWHHRRYRFLLWAAVSFAAALVLPCILSLSLTLDWIRNFGPTLRYVGSTLQANDSLSAQIVQLIHALWGPKLDAIKVIIPLTSSIILAVLFVRKRAFFRMDVFLLPSIILSPFLSGYSWFHDNVLLLIPYAVILGRATEISVSPDTRNEIFIWAAILNLTTVEAMHLLNPETYLFWYPLGMLYLYRRTIQLLKNQYQFSNQPAL